MSAIDKIRDHYNSLSKGEHKYFEEWDLTFYKEPINLEKKGKLFKILGTIAAGDKPLNKRPKKQSDYRKKNKRGNR